MKLIQRSSRNFLLFTSILLIVNGGLIFYIMTSIIEEEINERLYISKERIIQRLKNSESIPHLPPDIEIKEITSYQGKKNGIKDTVRYDPIEKEKELFRELNATESINGKTYQITVRQLIPEPYEYLGSIGVAIALILGVLLAGVYFINRRISQRIWKPFYQNLTILKSYSLQADKPIQLQPSNISEFKELNKAVEHLTEKVRSDYHTLKAFTENAAHEMQTPLSIVRAKLEVALQDPSLSEKLTEQINSAFSASRRLANLNKTLLLLTKIENRQFEDNERVNLATVTEKVISQYQEFLQAKNLTLQKELESVEITVNPRLLDILISNLLNNAVKHNYQNGTVKIVLQHHSLSIKNTGRPLKYPPETMFARFVKADQSSQSTGLGLSIVKKICEIYHWSVKYANEGEWHLIQVYF
ncbi:MAG: hypothetical protein K9I68_10245 [Bacteroidales bacterium]|nr:hypothetical protein [Bacteroidales bacterium]MCF8336683.1 hypothetical protein [Bacteroidales bacterium]